MPPIARFTASSRVGHGTTLAGSYRGPAFATLDRNADGIITRDEYAAATGVPATPVVVAPAAPVVAAPVAPVCGPGTNVACAPVVYAPLAYAPVVVHPTPTPRYSWHSADSNPPVPAP